MTEANRLAWNTQRFDAWATAFGSAEAEAERIIAEPEQVIRRISLCTTSIAGKRICNVQGFHSRIAVALALLGAEVQVINFSKENRRFALDLAAVAQVSIDYVVYDIMEAASLDLPHKFDVPVFELGILHYHQNLDDFLQSGVI